MAKKFNRNFKLTIQNNPNAPADISLPIFNNFATRLFPNLNLSKADNKNVPQNIQTAITIAPPFTVEIDVDRIIGSGSNNTVIKIYGLNEKTRRQLVKDIYNIPVVDQKPVFREVILEGGYGKTLYPIFIGSLLEGYSAREGVDQVTILRCASGAFGRYNTFINQSYGAETPYSKVLEDTIKYLEDKGGIKRGAITQIDGNFDEGYTALGDSFQVLSQFGAHVFIDLGKINILQLNEVIQAKDIYEINADTGLIGTPIRRETYIEVQTMFEPRIQLGGLISLKSDTAKYFNGQFKVMRIRHSGVFSNAKDGKLITTLGLWIGNYLVNGFKSISAQ